jgi:hypothetical protein
MTMDKEQEIKNIRDVVEHRRSHSYYEMVYFENHEKYIRFLLDELEQTRKESNMLREELHKFQELAIKAANHHKAERDKLIEGLRKLYRILKTDHDEAHEAEAYDVCDLLEEPLEIVQNILHEIGVTVE